MTTTTVVGIGIAVLLCYVVSLILRGLRNARAFDSMYDTAVSEKSVAKLRPPLTEPDFAEFNCTHPRRAGPQVVRVNGHEVLTVFGDAMPLCAVCVVQWFEKYCTSCAACGKPILPAMPIATAPSTGSKPYVHLEPTCFRGHAGAAFGLWGQGRAHWYEGDVAKN